MSAFFNFFFFLFPLLISSIPTVHLVSSAGAWLPQRARPAPPSSELTPRLLPPSSPVPPSSELAPRPRGAGARWPARRRACARPEEAREAPTLARAVGREATCSPRWVPPSSSSRAPVLLPPILSRAAAGPKLTRAAAAAAAHLGGSPVRRGRRRSPHARRRSPGPGAEVIGSGRSLRARRRPGRGGAHASSSTPVSPCFFLLPQLWRAPSPLLVLLTCGTRDSSHCGHPRPRFIWGAKRAWILGEYSLVGRPHPQLLPNQTAVIPGPSHPVPPHPVLYHHNITSSQQQITPCAN